MNKPKVSICVPIYGVERYIQKCAISLFEQTYDYIEYIFIDDCSLDGSIKVLRRIINDYPQRSNAIKIIEQNKGLAGARNTALKYATGEFILWVDPDDYIDIHLIEYLVKKQQETNSDIVSCDAFVKYPHFNQIWHQPKVQSPKELTILILSRNAPITIWGRLIRISLYKSNHITVQEGINMGEDYQVIPKLTFYSKKVSSVDIPLYYYNQCNNQAYTRSLSLRKMEETWTSFEIVKKFFYNKGEEYLHAIQECELKIIYENIIACTIAYKKEYLKQILPKLYANKKNWKILPFPKRLVFLLNNTFLLRPYILLAHNFLQLVKNIKSRFKHTKL